MYIPTIVFVSVDSNDDLDDLLVGKELFSFRPNEGLFGRLAFYQRVTSAYVDTFCHQEATQRPNMYLLTMGRDRGVDSGNILGDIYA